MLCGSPYPCYSHPATWDRAISNQIELSVVIATSVEPLKNILKGIFYQRITNPLGHQSKHHRQLSECTIAIFELDSLHEKYKKWYNEIRAKVWPDIISSTQNSVSGPRVAGLESGLPNEHVLKSLSKLMSPEREMEKRKYSLQQHFCQLQLSRTGAPVTSICQYY